MAVSPATPRVPKHARSISLPSTSHPATLEIVEQLHHLSALEASPSSSAILSHNLSGLRDLYGRVDALLQLPLTQQILSHERQENCVDEILNGSLRLVDAGSTARDVLSQLREHVQDLQSACRRRCSELDQTNEVKRYIFFRKRMIKEMRRCVAEMWKLENKRAFCDVLDRDNNSLVAIVHALNQVEQITLDIFGSLLSFVSGPKGQFKPSGWSFVSKLMLKNRVACEGTQADISEMEKVDLRLKAFVNHKSRKGNEVVDMKILQMELEKIELGIRDLERGMECVFRRLIKTRVSLLNVLNH